MFCASASVVVKNMENITQTQPQGFKVEAQTEC